MNQVDFVGGPEPAQRFLGQTTNTRESSAAEKAQLCLALGYLMKKPPPAVVNGSVQLTRRWLCDLRKAKKVARSTKCTAPELRGAISMMCAYL